MTKDESCQISRAIDDLVEAITFLHLLKMAAGTIQGEGGNAMEMVSDLTDKRLIFVRERLYGLLNAEAPKLKGER